jgi:ABC-2 type transport system ATP-binding protein
MVGGLKMNDVIHTTNLSKHYGQLRAVDNISLSVGKGEIYGFLGLNGAGKTTTIRMLLGMIQPTAGVSYLNGQKVNPGNYEIWGTVGYMVEIPYSYPELSVRENLEIISKLRHIPGKNAVDRIIGKLKLDSYANIQAKHLSLGNAQRLGLAKALLHNPSILILDEPTIGLDPAGIVEIRELLYDLAQNQGVAIFISSHILGEISKLTSRIGIIHNGLLIQEVNSVQLDSLRHKRLLLNSLDKAKAVQVLTNAGYNVELTEDGIMGITTVKALTHPEEIARILVQADCPPTQLNIEEEDLEGYFLRTIQETGGKSNEKYCHCLLV